MLKLDPDQQKVIDNFQKHKLMIVSGSPGSGKTAIISEICNLIDNTGAKYRLCAPTGKAAKRMQELTKRDAKTIHRLLKAGFGFWYHNKLEQILNIDYVIVDEVSMLDLEVMWHLIQSFPSYTHFIFVGDVHQLPSVGPGSVLRDMVRSNKIPTYYLTYNHRQGKGSLIAHDAKLINKGELKLTFDEDINFVEANNPIEIREKLPHLIAQLKNEGYNLISQCQVLSPQHSTQIGVTALNEMLRYLINKQAKSAAKISTGDKVIQTVNDYQLGIFNGYIGQVVEEDYYNLKIKFFDSEKDNTIINYPKHSQNNLMLAYCTTIHKFQGSESPAIIIILSSSHTYMWTRNLLYTAVTRAKEKCVILGDAATFRKAIVCNTENVRYSKLYDRLIKVK